jgi:lactate permease
LFLLTGLTAALGTWAAVRWVGASVSAMCGGLAVIVLLVLAARRLPRVNRAILRDALPFVVIIAGLSLVNLVPALHKLAVESAAVTFHIVPNRPCTLHPLFDAYTYLFAALGLSLAVFPFEPGRRKRVLTASLGKAWKPILAMAFFGAMGQMVAFTGWTAGFTSLDKERNLAWILAQGTFNGTGSVYPVFAGLLGWVGTFLSGYGVASIMLFGPFQVVAAGLLGVDPARLAAAMAIGASIGSVSSPLKIAIATPLCDGVGKEGEILRKTIPLGLAISLALGVSVWLVG